MTLKELLGLGSGGLALVLTLIQISKIEINPWSWLAKTIGRAINAEVLNELKEVKSELEEVKTELAATQEKFAEHIKIDDDRDADAHRKRILQFNEELIRNLRHTEENFIEILSDIDFYKKYCSAHKDYQNGRAVHAIANIERVYDARLRKGDFLRHTDEKGTV